MKLTKVICCAVLAAGLAGSDAALPAQIERDSVSEEDHRIRIKLSGQIVPEDVVKFQRVARAALQEAETIFATIDVFLDSPGGDVAAAMAIGRQIRANDMFTTVEFTCNSSCIFIFAAGVYRYAEYRLPEETGRRDVAIGIHRPFYAATETVSARAADLQHKQLDALVRAYFKEMNVADTLADAMLRTPPENVHYLTWRELDQYGLQGADPGFAQRMATSSARRYGLTMPEYYARVSRVKEKCAGTGVGAEYHYCREGGMYGISAAEFRRRENSTAQICGDPTDMYGATRLGQRECVRAVMQGARYKPLPPAVQVTAARTVEEKQQSHADPADIKLIAWAVTRDGRKYCNYSDDLMITMQAAPARPEANSCPKTVLERRAYKETLAGRTETVASIRALLKRKGFPDTHFDNDPDGGPIHPKPNTFFDLKGSWDSTAPHTDYWVPNWMPDRPGTKYFAPK
jgi:hypothetical protein